MVTSIYFEEKHLDLNSKAEITEKATEELKETYQYVSFADLLGKARFTSDGSLRKECPSKALPK